MRTLDMIAAEKLAIAWTRSGMTQLALGRKSGLHPSWISTVFNGSYGHSLQLSSIEKLAKAMGYTVELTLRREET